MDFSRRRTDEHVETVIEGRTTEPTILLDECFRQEPVEPFTMVIFGATGDLTARKLAPALYNLYLLGAMPESFRVVGAGRAGMSHNEFRERMRAGVSGLDMSRWDAFAASLSYHPVQFDSPASFARLSAALHALQNERNPSGNKVFYMAIPPSLYETTVEMLGTAGLSREQQNGNGWVRIVVEKPFGRNLGTAIDLNRTLQKHFGEQQIFRIDHYLAKETVQNVLMLRFANAIFEPLWNRMFIDHVHITAAEALGVENRAKYYEESGVLRDMFQNHMMQLLSLVAIEAPSRLEAEHVRDEKSKVFRSLRTLSPEDSGGDVVLGQYGPGIIDGQRVPGYRQESGVSTDSLTPTFAMIKVYLDNWRWQGVPFYLTSGKRLAKKMTQMVIHFKGVPHSMFQGAIGDIVSPNILTLGVYPDEKISLSFQTKNPGTKVCLRSVRMDFNYRQDYHGPILDSYEKAILDCIQGDQMLFWRQDAVELCWSFLEPLLRECENCPDRADRLFPYTAGSWGPEAAYAWRE